MPSISDDCGNFFSARASISTRSLYLTPSEWQESRTFGECGDHPRLKLALGVLVHHSFLMVGSYELIQLRIVAMIVAFCFILIFLFLPETFWSRTPGRSRRGRKASFISISNILQQLTPGRESPIVNHHDDLLTGKQPVPDEATAASGAGRPAISARKSTHRVEFAAESNIDEKAVSQDEKVIDESGPKLLPHGQSDMTSIPPDTLASTTESKEIKPSRLAGSAKVAEDSMSPPLSITPAFADINSSGYFGKEASHTNSKAPSRPSLLRAASTTSGFNVEGVPLTGAQRYTRDLRKQPAKTFKQTLKPWNGKLCDDRWFLVALRPFILFAYPAILWSTLIYSLSIGWLIVLSESMAYIFQNRATYNFSALGTGLVYISPFIGGVLGTAVAGKVSDIIVRFMSRRNEGIYEPEFRLVMGLPVAVSTCIGLMGFGWSAAERDKWIVPTVFFGIISFGCALGSTTAITFAVDSYRQYAGEALVTLNFSKSRLSTSYRFSHSCVFTLSR